MEACSIIIPAFNAEQFLSETVDHVKRQTFERWELIVVDDGSTDRTPVIAEAFAAMDARVRVVRQKNSGLANARNRGLQLSNVDNEYVLFLDADDLLHPEAIQQLIDTIRSQPESPACHGAACFIDEKGGELPDLFPARLRRQTIGAQQQVVDLEPREPTPLGAFFIGNCITTAGQVLVRRQTLRQVGEFDPLFSPVADWDMWYRIAQQCGPLLYVPRVVISYRVHSGSMSARYSTMKPAIARFLLKRRRCAKGPQEVRLLDAGQRHLSRQIHQEVTLRMAAMIENRQWGSAVRGSFEWLYTLAKVVCPPVWFQRVAVVTTGVQRWRSLRVLNKGQAHARTKA